MTGRTLNLLARFTSLLLAWALAAPLAHAQWTASGASGQSTVALSDPGKALALASGARVLVVGQEDNRLSVVNPDTGAVLGQVLLPYEPRSVAIAADGSRAYVVYGNSRLTAVDVAARTIIATWTVGGDLRSLVLMPGETELAVADSGPNRLLGVSATTGTINRQVSLAHEPRDVIRGNGDAKLVVGAVNGWLITVDGGSFSVLSQLKLADEIRSLSWWQAGARALAVHKRADAVSLVDIAANQVTATVALDGDPDRAAMASAGSVGYIATQDDASVNRVDLAGPTLLGRYAIAARVNALVFDPAANVLYGALRNDQKLVRLDPSAASLISVLQLQKRLRDVAINRATQEAAAVADKSDEMFVVKLADRTVRQIALPARPDLVAVDSVLNRAVVAFRGSGAKLRFADLAANTLFPETIGYDRNLEAIAIDASRALALAIVEGERPVLVIDINARARLADGPADRYRALAVHAERGVAYLATEGRQLKVMDLATRAIAASVDLGFRVNAIAVDEALDKAVLTTHTGNKAHVLDLATLQIEASHTLPSHPGALAIQADTHVAVIASRESDKISLLDLNANTLSAGFTALDKPHALAVSGRYNLAVALSGERDEVAFVQLPNPVPVLQSLAPVQAPAGNPALVLTLTGKGFVDSSKVFFGTLALATRWKSAAELQADVPASALATPGTVQVTVQNPAPAGGTSNALPFTVAGAPVLSAIAPASALADGQAKALILTGQNFTSGSAVLFGSAALPATFQSSTSLALTVPASLTGTPAVVEVSVINPGGLISNSLPFTLTPVLAISSVSPPSADVGAVVTLNGAGFDPVPANNLLVFRGIDNTTVPAAAISATPSTISVRVPPLAESGPITLTNSRGTVQSPPFTVAREQNYDLVVSPAALTVFTGASGAAQAQLSSTGTKQYTGLVTLSVQGLPNGVTASFAPAATLSAFQAGTITLSASTAAAPGSYPLTVRADAKEGGSTFSRTSAVTLNVQSGAGVTGIKGRFVTPEGAGISGVIVRADIAQNPQPQTTTDAAGNFQLTGLPAGAVTFRFDATPANPLYPIWPYTTTTVAGQVTVIADWTINPPPSADKFVPISNATQTQIVSDPRFPGLEIKLPAGVSIIGWDGVPKTRIAVEKIMPDKLPVTAPPVPIREAYQLYFGTPMGGIPSEPIPVTLPNVSEREPGEQVEIWFFDGSPMGGSGEWKKAGLGTVSPDGKTVASNPGVGIPRFCGVCGLLSLNCPPPPNPPQPPPGDCPKCGKPVDLFTGQELMKMDLMSLSGLTPIKLSMAYNPVDAFNNRAGTVASLGFGWVSSYDVAFLPFTGPQKRLVMPGSVFVNFVDDGSGTYRSFDDPRYDGAEIRATNSAASEWELKYKDGRVWRFKPFAGIPGVIRGGPPTFVTEMVDHAGNVLSISRQSNGRIVAVGNQNRNVSMTYGTNGFVSQLRDTANRTVQFTYTPTNRIKTVTDPDGKVASFTYVDDTEIVPDSACSAQPTMGERIKTVLMPGWNAPTENFYGSSRRVLRQRAYDGREYRFAYKVTGACVTHVSNPGVRCLANCPNIDSWENFQAGWRIHGGQTVGSTVSDPSGAQSTFGFTAKGTAPTSTNGEGQLTKRKFDSANRLIERTDALGRTWKYEYDDAGNITRFVDPIGRVGEYTYDAKWQLVTSFTRFLPDGTRVVARYSYDPQSGNLTGVTDPMGRAETYAYTARGQNSALTTLGNRTSTFRYNDAGDLVSVTDPLGNEGQVASDGAGRATAVTDALGFTSTTEYNGAGQVTKLTDALGQISRKNYDAMGRLTGIVNPLNNPIESYQYDINNRVSRITDALNKSTSLTYDSAGRLATTTNRNGAVTTYTYDLQNRLTAIVYGDGTVQTRTYDAAGRLVEVREPDNSAKFTYDNVNRVVKVVTDNAAGVNEVSYTYDTLDRVTSRAVNGTDATTYTFDKAGRPTSMTYRGQTTTYAWDSEGNLESKVLPDGIVQSFEYDATGRITRLQYAKADGTVIEAIAYTYDAKGNRLTRTSGVASTQETPMTATYDAANRMTSITLTGTGQIFDLAYDGNGNLLTKTERSNPSNVTTYAWNSRNKLVRIQAPGFDAAFAYDFMGRRISRTLNGQTVNYVYDGRQAIGEMRGGTISVSLLTTVAIDDVVARHTSAGARTYLTDALRNVIALAKDDQSIQNYYSYTPYGEVTTLGDDEGNSIQYTGRENDRTGLYFYRARYYDPVLKRFISEDPIGLAGGPNAYAYVEGDPIGATDPSGLTLRAWWIQLPTPGFDGLSDFDVTPVDVKIEGPLNVVFFYVTARLKAHVDFSVGCEETDECGSVKTWTTSASIPFSVPVRWPIKINLIGTFLGFKYGLAGKIAWALIQVAIYAPDAKEFYDKYKELMSAAALLAEQLASQDPTVFCYGGD